MFIFAMSIMYISFFSFLCEKINYDSCYEKYESDVTSWHASDFRHISHRCIQFLLSWFIMHGNANISLLVKEYSLFIA